MPNIHKQEQQRLYFQERLDNEKTQVERNRMGQFATPTALATDILEYARSIFPKGMDVRFLDPAIGTGSFYSALIRAFGANSIQQATGFEIDKHYGIPAQEMWKSFPLHIKIQDFTKATAPNEEREKATLVICNPPYVRHHNMKTSEKERLQLLVSTQHKINFSGLSGLYCYFLCLSGKWMARNAIAGWLIPSEFMDVNYGKVVKEFLLNHVTLLHIHRFSPDDVQFGDALVSSAVIWFRNTPPTDNHHVRFSFGGSLNCPISEKYYSSDFLFKRKKWTSLPEADQHTRSGNSSFTLGDFFNVKRGIATGSNSFFVMSPEEAENRHIPASFLIPILPSPRYLKTDFVDSDELGMPLLDRYGMLFSSEMKEGIIRREYPAVWKYLQTGCQMGIPERYICRNRDPWYYQEKRVVAPFLCTYMGRSNGNGKTRLFRFILNRSKAIAANVYLMLYPKPWIMHKIESTPDLANEIWRAINSIPIEHLLVEGRVYGGGLHKLEPKELLNVPADSLASIFPDSVQPRSVQMTLF